MAGTVEMLLPCTTVLQESLFILNLSKTVPGTWPSPVMWKNIFVLSNYECWLEIFNTIFGKVLKGGGWLFHGKGVYLELVAM